MQHSGTKITVSSGRHTGGSVVYGLGSVVSIGRTTESDVVLSDLPCGGEACRIAFVAPRFIDIYSIGVGLRTDEGAEIGLNDVSRVELPCRLTFGGDLKIEISIAPLCCEPDTYSDNSSYHETEVKAVRNSVGGLPNRMFFRDRIRDAIQVCLSVASLVLVFSSGTSNGASPESPEGMLRMASPELQFENENEFQLVEETGEVENDQTHDHRMMVFRSKLKTEGLESINLSYSDGAIMVEGILSERQMADWSAIPPWFDSVFGSTYILLADLKVFEQSIDVPSRPKSMSLAEPAYIVDALGRRLREGEFTQDGWRISKISMDGVLLEKAGDEVLIDPKADVFEGERN